MATRAAKIKRLNDQDSPADVQSLTETVGANTSTSTNAAIAAKGAAATTAATNLRTAIRDGINKKNASVEATGVTHTKNGLTATAYNNLAATVEIEDPNNPDGWRGKGFVLTQTEVTDLPLPGQVTNGSVTNGDFPATADLHHEPVPGAKNYTHRVTKDDPSDDSKYIAITSPKTQFTKSNAIIDIPADYVNVPLFWKSTAHNTAGAGPESLPYGGGRING